MIKSRLTEELRKVIIKKIDIFYIRTINYVSKYSGGNNVGGKIRQSMGDLGEDLAKVAWMEVAKLYADISKPVKRGNTKLNTTENLPSSSTEM